MTTTFALRTSDAAWIRRIAPSPARLAACSSRSPPARLRRSPAAGSRGSCTASPTFPADALNASLTCPAAWVEAPEVTAQRPEALSGKALFLARWPADVRPEHES